MNKHRFEQNYFPVAQQLLLSTPPVLHQDFYHSTPLAKEITYTACWRAIKLFQDKGYITLEKKGGRGKGQLFMITKIRKDEIREWIDGVKKYVL